MDANLDNIAKELYGKIQTRFPSIKIGGEDGQVLFKKEDIPQARFFEFKYSEGGKPLATITMTLDDDEGLVIKILGDFTPDNQPSNGHRKAYKWVRSFKGFARGHGLKFDAQTSGQSNLDKRDYNFLTKRPEETGEGNMMESKLFGTSKVSYQDLGEARLIIKHSAPVNPELAAGRTLHIESIYIENGLGERFLYPSKHLNGARALAEHIKNGGTPYDAIGKHVIGLSEELASLRRFKGYVSRQDQLSEAMGQITDRVAERIDQIKETISKLQRPSFYQQFVESFEEQEEQIIPEEVVNDLVDRLTIRTFNEELKAVFPYIYKLSDDLNLPVKELGVNDLLGEEKEKCDDCGEPIADCECDDHDHKTESYDPEIELESFMDSLISEEETTPNRLFSDDESVQKQAIKDLNDIFSKGELKAGGEGINAINTLKGLIDDPDFVDELKDIDSELDARPVVQALLVNYDENNGTTIAQQLDFNGDGDKAPVEQEPAAETPPAAPPAPAAPEQPAAAEPAAAPAPEQPAPVAENQNYTADEMVAILSGQKTQAQVDAEKKSKSTSQPTPQKPAPTKQTKESDDPPFDPDPPRKNPSALAGKHGQGHSTAKHLAKQGLMKAIARAKKAGAELDTRINLGGKEMTLLDAIEECGMTPMECGFENNGSDLQAMKEFMQGFWNTEEKNFTIGGQKMKDKLLDKFPNANERDIEDAFGLVDKIDPPEPIRQQNDILRLAGVDRPVDETSADMDIDAMFNDLMKQSGAKTTSSSSGMINGKPASYDDAMAAAKGMKIKLPKFGSDDEGDEVLDFSNPDAVGQTLQKKMGGMMKGVQGQMPNQNIQFPGGQMNPADMMKQIMGKINFGK